MLDFFPQAIVIHAKLFKLYERDVTLGFGGRDPALECEVRFSGLVALSLTRGVLLLGSGLFGGGGQLWLAMTRLGLIEVLIKLIEDVAVDRSRLARSGCFWGRFNDVRDKELVVALHAEDVLAGILLTDSERR
jgi:hypothetical protein